MHSWFRLSYLILVMNNVIMEPPSKSMPSLFRYWKITIFTIHILNRTLPLNYILYWLIQFLVAYPPIVKNWEIIKYFYREFSTFFQFVGNEFNYITLGHSGFLIFWNGNRTESEFMFCSRVKDGKNTTVSNCCLTMQNYNHQSLHHCKIHSLEPNTLYEISTAGHTNGDTE